MFRRLTTSLLKAPRVWKNVINSEKITPPSVCANSALSLCRNFSLMSMLPNQAQNIFTVNNNAILCRAISTFKRRRTKMNQHKLKKRRKKLRMNTKISRE
jgi:hypothetical protein